MVVGSLCPQHLSHHHHPLNIAPAARGKPALKSPWKVSEAAAATTEEYHPFLELNTGQNWPLVGRGHQELSMELALEQLLNHPNSTVIFLRDGIVTSSLQKKNA